MFTYSYILNLFAPIFVNHGQVNLDNNNEDKFEKAEQSLPDANNTNKIQ